MLVEDVHSCSSCSVCWPEHIPHSPLPYTITLFAFIACCCCFFVPQGPLLCSALPIKNIVWLVLILLLLSLLLLRQLSILLFSSLNTLGY